MVHTIAQRSALVVIATVFAAAGIFIALIVGGNLPHSIAGTPAYATSITVSK